MSLLVAIANMTDMCSSSTSFEDLGDEENDSSLANNNLAQSLLQKFESLPSNLCYDGGDGDNEETIADIQSLTSSDISGKELWIFCDKEFDNQSNSGKSRRKSPLDEQPKIGSIIRCLLNSDIDGLKKLARQKFGLLNDSLRLLVWPKLVKADMIETIPRPDNREMETHPFYTQVVMDVNRSLKRFPPSIEETQRLSMQQQLIQLIMRVLIKNPSLYYYQGYHDICVTFLLILGEEMAFHVVDSISRTHLKQHMEKTMETTADLMEFILIMVDEEDGQLGDFMYKSGVGTIFALSWVITWFSHIFRDYKTVGRLFDLFLADDPMLPIYLSTTIVLYKKDDILKLDCDMAVVHQYLCSILEREEDLPIEELIIQAKELFAKYPPDKLRSLQKIKPRSIVTKRKEHGALISLIFAILDKGAKFSFIPITVTMVLCAIVYQQYLSK